MNLQGLPHPMLLGSRIKGVAYFESAVIRLCLKALSVFHSTKINPGDK